MKFTKTSSKIDPVVTYTSEDGFYKITKKPGDTFWTLKRISMFSIMGEVVGNFDTLEDAMNF